MVALSLRLGSFGTRVSNLQNVLNHVLPLNPLLATDAIFGEKTKARVVAFQRKLGMVADGVVGASTAKALVASVLDRPLNRIGPR